MDHTKLGPVESRFADIIWEHEPLSSGELVKLCQEELEWKKSTTYTVLKKLCQRGLFQNQDGCVRALLSREEYQGLQSRQFVEENFDGSLPAFLAAFSSGKALTEPEIREIQKLMEKFGEG